MKFSRIISAVLCLSMILSCTATVGFAADAEFVIIDSESRGGITDAGEALSVESKITQGSKFSAKWVVKDATTLRVRCPGDITPYTELKFRVYSETAGELFFWFKSENSATSGADYYGDLISFDAGWNDISIELATLPATRTPLGYSKINRLEFLATGWNMKNDTESMVLYFEDMKLVNNENYGKLSDTEIVKPSTDTTGYDDTKEPGTDILYNRNYDEKGMDIFAGLLKFPKSNKLGVYIDENKNNSIQLSYSADAKEDGYFEVTLDSNKTFFVTELDLSTTGNEPAGVKLEMKDSDRATALLFNISDGKIVVNKKEIGEVKKGEWTKVSLVINMAKNTADIYINGKLTVKGHKFGSAAFKNIILMRVYGGAANAGRDILVDNFKLYEGKEIRDIGTEQPKVAVTEGTGEGTTTSSYVRGSALEAVSDAVCLRLNTPNGLVNGIKTPIDPENENVSPFVINGRTLVPVRFVSEALGAVVGWDAATQKVTLTKGSDILELTIGSDILKKNGADVKLDTAAAIYYDRTMLPLRAVAEAFGKQVFWDDLGLIIISDKENILGDYTSYTPVLEVMGEMTYERPSGEKIYADLKATNPAHPRLLADKTDFDRIRSLYGTDETLTKWVDGVIAAADGYVAYDVLPTLDIDSGGRWAPPDMGKAMNLGLAYQVTGEQKYVDAMWFILEELCSFENWHPGHYLNCADCMKGVAVAYDWMYDAWTDEQKKIIEEASLRNAINSGLGAYEGAVDHITSQHGTFGRSEWTKTTNNWNAVCNGGLTMMSIAMFDVYPEECKKLMEQIMVSIERGVECYAPDGSYAEGPNYWAYGTGNLTYMLMSLDKAMGTTYGIFEAPGLANTCYFPCFVESKQGSWNFHDSAVQNMATWPLDWFGKKLGDADLVALRRNEVETGAKAVGITDILGYDPNLKAENVNLPPDKYFKGVETVFMRSAWSDETAIFTGLHGGYNNVNHGNLDAGSFILDAAGERFICDLGQDNYNMSGYFGKGEFGSSYKYYRKNSEGQNNITIVGDSKAKYGQWALADIPIVNFQTKERGGYAIADMTAAYGTKVTDGKRGVMLTNNRSEVIVQDEITFSEPAELYWFAHSERSEITINEDKKSAVITKNGKRLSVQLISDNPNLELGVMEAKPVLSSTAKAPSGEYARDNFTKLFIHAKDVTAFNAAVVFKVLEDTSDKAAIGYSYTPMSNWTLEDGALLETPVLDALYANGQLIEGFNAKTTGYTAVLPYNATDADVWQITAEAADEYDVLVSQATTLDGVSYVTVSRKDDPTVRRTYSVGVQKLPETIESGRWERIAAVASVASDTPEANHPADKVSDGNTADESRWSAQGDGQWVTVDIGAEHEIGAIGLSVWKGTQRNYIFKVQVSSDGENFTDVLLDKQSSGLVNSIEIFEFASPVKARYVRYVGYGNTANKWNSLTEFAPLKKK